MTPVRELGSSTWTDVIDRELTILVPVGAVEQHGPHLPMDTDGRIAVEVATRALGQTAPPVDALTAPSIAYGASGEHEGFPGTVSIGADVMERLIVEYGRSACRWAKRIVFVNGHGGNAMALATAVRLLRYEGRDVAWWPCAFRGADAHAGDTETSILLAADPDQVRVSTLAPGNTEPIATLMPALRDGGVAVVSPNGVLGDPTGADAARGEQLLDENSRDLAASLESWVVGDDGRLA